MDILSKLGKKKEASVEGTASAVPGQSKNDSSQYNSGDDLLATAGQQASDSDTAAVSSQKIAEDSLESKSSSGKEEPSGSETVNNPDSWTKDSAFKEIKKLREENKAYRVKYAEQLETLEKTADDRLKSRDAELEQAKTAQKELNKIKAEQEDKKRDTEEKLVHREKRLAELETMGEIREKEHSTRLQELQSKVATFEAERQAELAIHKGRLDEELNKIPSQYREHAELIVKGSGDSRDALIAIHEAKLKGMFDDKTAIVNHRVPGAQDGARSTKDRLDAAANEQRNNMTSSQKIKFALDAVKQGQANSAFRGRK